MTDQRDTTPVSPAEQPDAAESRARKTILAPEPPETAAFSTDGNQRSNPGNDTNGDLGKMISDWLKQPGGMVVARQYEKGELDVAAHTNPIWRVPVQQDGPVHIVRLSGEVDQIDTSPEIGPDEPVLNPELDLRIAEVTLKERARLRADVETAFAGQTWPTISVVVAPFRTYATQVFDVNAEAYYRTPSAQGKNNEPLRAMVQNLLVDMFGCEWESSPGERVTRTAWKTGPDGWTGKEITTIAGNDPDPNCLYHEIVGDAIFYRYRFHAVQPTPLPGEPPAINASNLEWWRYVGLHERHNIAMTIKPHLDDRIAYWQFVCTAGSPADSGKARASEDAVTSTDDSAEAQSDLSPKRRTVHEEPKGAEARAAAVMPVNTASAITKESRDEGAGTIDGNRQQADIQESQSSALTIEKLLRDIDKSELPFPRERLVATLESKVGRHIGELRCSIPISELPPVGRLSRESWRRVEKTLFVLAEDLLSAVFGSLSLHNAAVYEETAGLVASKVQGLILRIWGRFVGEDVDESDYFCFLQEIEITIHQILNTHLAEAWRKHEKSHREAAEQMAGAASDTKIESVNQVSEGPGHNRRNEALPPLNGNSKNMPSQIGRNIDRLREECGWTFDVLAEKTSLEKTSVLDHVRKGIKPRPPNLKNYADVFSKALSRTITVSDLQS